MENIPGFENRETVIDRLIDELAKREEMETEDILSDIITFAPYEGNEASNPDYLDVVADKIGIPYEEMREYALKKLKDQIGE